MDVEIHLERFTSQAARQFITYIKQATMLLLPVKCIQFSYKMA